MKALVVDTLYWLDATLDHLPHIGWDGKRLYVWPDQLGCALGLARFAADLEQRWGLDG